MKPDPIKAYLSEIGRKGGKVSSPTKTTAARKNGKRGGPPKGNQNAAKRRPLAK